MLKTFIPFTCTLLLTFAAFAKPYEITKLEPANWWVGMNHPHLQLMVYGPSIATLDVTTNYLGVQITSLERTNNPNYLFINLTIDENTKAGTIEFTFKKDGKTKLSHHYPLLKRNLNAKNKQGFNPSDVIYLIAPDRFVNGDLTNDNMPSMLEAANRSDDNGRHGGDIKGIKKALPYLASMGYTAIWPMPLTENNQSNYSYHGYAATDLYKIDPRFGTNEDYKELVASAASYGIKFIQDIILNHIGDKHWWMRDLPDANWLNQQEISQGAPFIGTNHNRTTIQDPYASKKDTSLFTDGWFVPTMPDLNQRHPLLATYLIQNSIWWIEYANLSGIREDTYSYADKAFLSQWGERILSEYPHFNIVGEEWSPNPLIVSYWQRGKVNKDGYVSHTPSMLDFPLYDALLKALTSNESWNLGWITLYEMLSNDHVYANPFNLVTFEGNHDAPRLFSVLNEDVDLYRMAISYLLTMRGIPQMFYGTEILMTSPKERADGLVRADFPGGWPNDKVNAFTGEGLSDKQKEAQQFVKTLLNFRKTASAIHNGKLMHFAPDNGTYTFFRYNEEQTIMVVMNKSSEIQNLNLARFKEVLTDKSTAFDVITQTHVKLTEGLTLKPRQTMILDIKH